jgi:hypothetical protein
LVVVSNVERLAVTVGCPDVTIVRRVSAWSAVLLVYA